MEYYHDYMLHHIDVNKKTTWSRLFLKKRYTLKLLQ